MGLPKELPCEVGSFSCHLNPHRYFQSEVLRLCFPRLEPWVVRSSLFPSCSSWFICMQMWDRSLCQPPPRLPCCKYSPPRLPVSAPPTGLDECFSFNSLVVVLPYSLIFWKLWLLFVFKFVVVLLLVVRGGKVMTGSQHFFREHRRKPHEDHCFRENRGHWGCRVGLPGWALEEG